MPKTKSTSINLKQLVKSAKDELNDICKAQAELDKKKISAAKSVTSSLKDIITTCPHIEAVRWAQYTPYFNDGEECTFSLNDLEFKFSEEITGRGDKTCNESADYDYTDDEFVLIYGGNKGIREYFEKRKDVLNFKDIDSIENIAKELNSMHHRLHALSGALQEVFGDHTQVTVTREGIETESYEHD